MSDAEPRPLALTTQAHDLPGVAPRLAEGLRALGLTNLGKLVAHLPHRHEFEHAESSVSDLVEGEPGVVRGEITSSRPAGRRGRAMRVEALLVDDEGDRLEIVFFNMPYMLQKVRAGSRVLAHGEPARRNNALQMVNPRIEVLPDAREPPARGARLRPVYPASEAVSSRAIERVIADHLPGALMQIKDHFGAEFRERHALPSLARAYRMQHTPADEDEIASGRRRLAYDELYFLQLGLALAARRRREKFVAPALRWTPDIDASIRARLPFELTEGQAAVTRELAGDLQLSAPASRLVQGDVGSGKTAVALYAMLLAVASGHQAALMAPTELLAEQHELTIRAMLRGSSVRIALLTGSAPAGERKRTEELIARGKIDLVIGTHALITSSARFRSLAVAIIDEQHRFGVNQRAQFRSARADEAKSLWRSESGRSDVERLDPLPHMIVMTATPIPRTLALGLLGDLDVSTIRGAPPGRAPIRTRVVGPESIERVDKFVAGRVARGERAYFVAPAIDSEGGGLRDVAAIEHRLTSGALAGRRVAVVHGRMDRSERERVMSAFRGGEIDALVATTVIEVGVDVPEATVMVIDHAERFGLAQLHQLRGRVGRGTRGGVCVLIGEPTTPDGQARLEAIRSTSDGFRIAERDLELRGPGEMLGMRQAGAPPLRVADLVGDADLLAMAGRDARAWLETSPRLDRDDDQLVRRRLLKAHGQWLDLEDLAVAGDLGA